MKGYFFVGQNKRFQFNRDKVNEIENMTVIVENRIWAQYPILVQFAHQNGVGRE
jgi:hypothetical protein